MALLAFAGFLRFDELSSLKLKDVVSHATYFELFIERSSGAPAARRAAKQSPISNPYMKKKRKPMMLIF